MAIYDKNGNSLLTVYGVDGVVLSQAYDINGNPLLDTGNLLKVMTYNVGHWYIGTTELVPTAKKTEYFDLHNGMLTRNEPDILFLQEARNAYCADGTSASAILSPHFDDIKSTSITQWYIGHEICTKNLPIQNYTSHRFTRNRGNYPTFETAQISFDGKTINLINTHNDYYADYQPSEISDLLSAISGMEYFILCGDFNINLAVEDTSDDQYTINVKPFVDAGCHVGNCVKDWIPTYFGTASPTGGKFTDQFITSPNINIVSLYADTTKLTDGLGEKIDHIPLIATLQIN